MFLFTQKTLKTSLKNTKICRPDFNKSKTKSNPQFFLLILEVVFTMPLTITSRKQAYLPEKFVVVMKTSGTLLF